MRTSIVLAIGLALIAAGIGMTLTRSPATLAGTNSVAAQIKVAVTNHNSNACEAGGVLPAGVSAIRLSLSAIIGPRVSVTALAGTHVVTGGARGAGWTGGSVLIPVSDVTRPVRNVRICFSLSDLNGNVEVLGEDAPPALAAASTTGEALQGRFRIEYVRPGHTSWLALVSSIATHFGFGRSPSGEWVVWVTVIAVLAMIALTSWLVLRELT
jgi:hypothetical protein